MLSFVSRSRPYATQCTRFSGEMKRYIDSIAGYES
ncbi:protein of unknown function [Burkholderia multivorans]